MFFSDNNIDYNPLKGKSCREIEVPSHYFWCAAAENRISHRKAEPYKEDYLGVPHICNSRGCVQNVMQ